MNRRHRTLHRFDVSHKDISCSKFPTLKEKQKRRQKQSNEDKLCVFLSPEKRLHEVSEIIINLEKTIFILLSRKRVRVFQYTDVYQSTLWWRRLKCLLGALAIVNPEKNINQQGLLASGYTF